jgi:hypothetical protein
MRGAWRAAQPTKTIVPPKIQEDAFIALSFLNLATDPGLQGAGLRTQ